MTYLRPVDDNEEAVMDDSNAIPSFEGQPVHLTRMKLTSASNLESEEVMKMDAIGRFYVEGRVSAIGHAVDEKTGKMIRIHTIKVTEAIALPWDFDTAAIFND